VAWVGLATGVIHARNVPVEVFQGDGQNAAPGRGRLLELGEDHVIIERLQMIGEEIQLSPGAPLDCFFRYKGALFEFKTKVLASRVSAQLNGRRIVPALKIERPRRVDVGQRRNVFRIQLSARADAPKLRLWFEDPYVPSAPPAPPPVPVELKEGEEPPTPPEPERLEEPREPDFEGRAVDASDIGMGILVYKLKHTRVSLGQRIWIALEMEDEQASEPLEFSAKIRHTAPVRDTDARLGIMFDDDESGLHTRRIRRLMAYLTRVQREQLSK